MKSKILAIATTLLIGMSCNKAEDNFPGTYPCCLQPRVDNALENSPTNPRTTIIKFLYKNKYVYMFGVPIPDMDVWVINDKCERVCSFDGFTGYSTCEDWEEAKFIGVVWEDPR